MKDELEKDKVDPDEDAPEDGGPGGESEDPVVIEDEAEGDEVVRDPNEIVAELEEKLAAEHERLLRAAADLDNLRKRTRRDVEDAAIRGRSEILDALLPAIDSLDLALGSSDPDGSAGPVLDGVEMVRKQFLSSMSRFGLAPVETAVGEMFDPAVHEAVAQIPSTDHPVGEVIEEMRKGYTLGDRLLRAAMVVVSAGQPDQEEREAVEETVEEAPPEEEDVSETEAGETDD
jgi:molecular chaperone GrpE